MASVAGVIAPLLWLAFMNLCYEPQFPLTLDGPPSRPRFVDDAVKYTAYVLWPAGVLLLPPTVSSHPQKTRWQVSLTGLILANAGIYAAVACAASLLWRRSRSDP